MRVSLIVALSLFVCSGAAHAMPDRKTPRVLFNDDGLRIAQVKPGSRVAWLAMIREPRNFRIRTRILRGIGPVTPDSEFAIAYKEAAGTYGIWAIADVANGTGVHAKPDSMPVSRRPLPVKAEAGATSITIAATAVEVLYVRPPEGAWSFSIADGGEDDADGTQNGSVVIALASFRALEGTLAPPETIAAGDLVLVIDSRRLRTATIEVKP